MPKSPDNYDYSPSYWEGQMERELEQDNYHRLLDYKDQAPSIEQWENTERVLVMHLQGYRFILREGKGLSVFDRFGIDIAGKPEMRGIFTSAISACENPEVLEFVQANYF